jgi:two-component system, NtrC family, nitrogen regulation sensor histidine kinase NtrY
VNRLRHKLILAFLAATLIPTLAILWMSVSLLKHSLSYIATDDVDKLSKSLEKIAREYYRQSCANLKEDAVSGRMAAQRFAPGQFSSGPPSLRQFSESREPDRCVLSEPSGDTLYYLVRRGSEVWVYSRTLNGIRMEELTQQYREARAQVEKLSQRDLRKGFTYTLILLSAVVWILALGSVVYLANRISRPIQDLTAGLHRLAAGDFEVRLNSGRQDEIGRAIQAFNHTARHLQQSRDRLVYLTQIASWQMLARKMAHELKNSLTPIRLTVEEILARSPNADRAFMEQASQVVIGEVESLQRRVRAFSEFAAEPSINATPLDLGVILKERIQFLEIAHPDVHYQIVLTDNLPMAWADADQIKEILTNLLENAAEAAGPGGTVRAIAGKDANRLVFEVHDSGPGLSEEARRSLFEPTISFKKHGMGLGLSIARKNALLAGGDLQAIDGSLGGAGFRLVLPTQKIEDQSGENESNGN